MTFAFKLLKKLTNLPVKNKTEEHDIWFDQRYYNAATITLPQRPWVCRESRFCYLTYN